MTRIVNLSGCWAATDMLNAQKEPVSEKPVRHGDPDIFKSMLDEKMEDLRGGSKK